MTPDQRALRLRMTSASPETVRSCGVDGETSRRRPSEVRGAGLEEYLIRPEGISLVEWMERWSPEPSPGDPAIRWISIRILDELSREITQDDPGA